MNSTLSIITICYNNLDELKDTCISVDNQTISPEEHLIIDGSTTKEIINWLTGTKQPKYRRWIHERDHGIPDAFNKGVHNSRYEVLQMLNSGDSLYESKVIEIVKGYFNTDPELQWCSGLYVQYRGGTNVISGVPFKKELLWKGMRTISHQSMFVKKSIFDKYGPFETTWKVAMDYDFLVRIRNEKYVFIPEVLVYFAPGGTSSLNINKGFQEVRMIYRKHIGPSIKPTLWQIRQILLNKFTNTKLGELIFKFKNSKKIV